jgi:hypothetical protein
MNREKIRLGYIMYIFALNDDNSTISFPFHLNGAESLALALESSGPAKETSGHSFPPYWRLLSEASHLGLVITVPIRKILLSPKEGDY